MRILLLTAGSRGDVQPLLALALNLQARGHQVCLAAPPNFAGWIGACGLRFEPFGSDMQALLEERAHLIGDKPIRLVAGVLDILQTEMAKQHKFLLRQARSFDLVVGGGVQLAAGLVCEGYGMPYCFVTYAPGLLPSRHHPPLTVPMQVSYPPANRMLWWFNDRLWNAPLLKMTNRYRRVLGLKPLRNFFDAIRAPGLKLVMATAPEMAPLPPDLKQVFQPGYLHYHPDQPLDADLEAFLDSEKPVVYIGFGSMSDTDPAHTSRLLSAAARNAGVRLLLSSGWSNLGHVDSTDPDLKVIGSVAHHLLFPRLAAVIHHGGAGTTSTAAWSGVPQLVVPHMMDQYFWGERVYQLGLGPRPLPRRALNPERLGQTIATILQNPGYRSAAAGISQKLQAQDGVNTLSDWLEKS